MHRVAGSKGATTILALVAPADGRLNDPYDDAALSSGRGRTDEAGNRR